MKNLINTTTDQIIRDLGIIDHAGDYAGRFQSEAFDLLNQLIDMSEFVENEWSDIMYKDIDHVYAVFAEDALTCSNANAMYVQIEESDCPEAFKSIRFNLNN
jgi:hypothetical protein